MSKIISVKNVDFIVDDDCFEFLNRFKWRLDKDGYARTAIQVGKNEQKDIRMHRCITLAPEGYIVDHINGNIQDNRRENLRIGDCSINAMNRRKTDKETTSKFKGVNYCNNRKRFVARIGINNKMFTLGRYKNEEDAAVVYNRMAKILYGEFAVFNDVVDDGRELSINKSVLSYQ